MSWSWAAFMPHPPIIVPDVGRGREQEARETLVGLDKLIQSLTPFCAGPSGKLDCLLILAPHQPYASGALFMNTAETLTGSLALFGAPHVGCKLQTNTTLAISLAEHLRERGIAVVTEDVPNITQDHSSLVPLYFLKRCFAEGVLPPVLIMNPIGLSYAKAKQFGAALADFSPSSRIALLASGDLSHSLTQSAPGGFHPSGKVFDQAVVEALEEGSVERLLSLPDNCVYNAKECGLRSAIVILEVVQQPLTVFSYEGPFGVGYCNALWLAGGPQPERPVKKKDNVSSHPYPELARYAIGHHVSGAGDFQWDPPASVKDAITKPGACFVTLKTREGDLRGCIGTIMPTKTSLGLEIVANAVAAATKDPRFPPISANELKDLVISVDVLSTPEPVASLDELDPERFGVIVSEGGRRGLLLPALEGVSSVDMQLSIAAQKAGLPDWHGAQLERFSVTRHLEGRK